MQKSLSIILLVSIIAFAAFRPSLCFSQTSASFSAAATIVTPNTVAKKTDFELSIRTAAFNGSKAQLCPNGKIARSHKSQANSKIIAASCSISGNANYTYGVAMPKAIVFSKEGLTISFAPIASASSVGFRLSDQGTDVLSVAGSFTADTAIGLDGNTRPTEVEVTIVYN
jgi:hypothetical protein